MSLASDNAPVKTLTPAELADRIFVSQLEPLIRQMPGQRMYPSINIGDVMPDQTWEIICRDCRAYGYEASIVFEGSTHLVTLTRICAEHERGPGDDFPHHHPDE